MNKSILFLTLLGTLALGLTFVLNSKQQTFVYQSRAAPTCDAQCQTEPSCCADIIKRYKALGGKPEDLEDLDDSEQPYHACPGLYDGQNERGYCRHETCDQLPQGLKYRGRCGWYWSFHEGATNTANGYGCMIGDSESSMRPICGGGSNPTASPQPNQSGSGSLKVVVHKGSATGPVWSSNDFIASPYTDKKSLLIYITGPSSNGHTFGELLYAPGKNGEQCSSRSGFAYTCSSGTVIWKGSDGKSGTSAGSYTAAITQAPTGVSIVKATGSGSLASGSTLTIDLVVSGQSNSPSATPPPGASLTPTPRISNTPSPTPTGEITPSNTPSPTGYQNQNSNLNENAIVRAVKNIFLPPSPTSETTNSSAPQPTSAANPVVENVSRTTITVLDTFGAIVKGVRYYDGVLENTINSTLDNIFRR